MISRGHSLFCGIIYSLAALGFVIAGIVLPEMIKFFLVIAAMFAAFGGWDLYKALEGRDKDQQIVSDLDSKISSLSKEDDSQN